MQVLRSLRDMISIFRRYPGLVDDNQFHRVDFVVERTLAVTMVTRHQEVHDDALTAGLLGDSFRDFGRKRIHKAFAPVGSHVGEMLKKKS